MSAVIADEFGTGTTCHHGFRVPFRGQAPRMSNEIALQVGWRKIRFLKAFDRRGIWL